MGKLYQVGDVRSFHRIKTCPPSFFVLILPLAERTATYLLAVISETPSFAARSRMLVGRSTCLRPSANVRSMHLMFTTIRKFGVRRFILFVKKRAVI